MVGHAFGTSAGASTEPAMISNPPDADTVAAAGSVSTAPLSRGGLIGCWRRYLQHIPLTRRTIPLTVALLALVHLGDAVLVVHYYRLLNARAYEERQSRASLLTEHAGRAMSAIDLSLEAIADALSNGAALNRPTPSTQTLLEKYVKQLPQVRALVVINRQGWTVNDSRLFPAPPIDLADRHYFSEQKKGRGVGLYISKTLTARRDHKPCFTVSRSIVDSNQKFLGVVLALAEPSYFSAFYGRQGSDETAVIERSDGAVLAGIDAANRLLTGLDSTDAGLFRQRNQAVTTIKAVAGFPLRVVIAGRPTWQSPEFVTFVIIDAGMLLTMTLVALWLAVAIKKADDRLRDAIESMPAGFALFDHGDRLILSNQLYSSLFAGNKEVHIPGNSFENIVQKGVSGLHDLNGMNEADYVAWRLARHREGCDLTRRLADGRWLLTRERPTKEGGVVSFHSNITPLKEKEEALQKSEEAERQARTSAENANRTKSSFLANMSHELRTPLNAIIGFAEMIAGAIRGPIPTDYRGYGEIIRDSGQHLLAIINDILDMSKLESGKTELNLEPVDIACAVTEAVQMLSQRAQTAKLELTAEIEPGLPPIRADRIRLRQILLNLLSNGIKFTPAGGRVSVAAHRLPREIAIAVADTGVGMAAEDIPRVMQPFTQITTDTSASHEGTGLGLPITKRLVEMHGGNIAIESTIDQGTTITIRFPIDIAASDAPYRQRRTGASL